MTNKNIDDYRGEIYNAFNRQFKANDEAHQVWHYEKVFETGCAINEVLELGFDEKLILFFAYFHDLFCWSRKNHHILATNWILTTDHPVIVNNLTSEEIELVAGAIRSHRASYKGEFRDKFAEAMNSADRERPDAAKIMSRAIDYGKVHFPGLSYEEQKRRAHQHVVEKYGKDGYARFPAMYMQVFEKELEEMREALAKM